VERAKPFPDLARAPKGDPTAHEIDDIDSGTDFVAFVRHRLLWIENEGEESGLEKQAGRVESSTRPACPSAR